MKKQRNTTRMKKHKLETQKSKQTKRKQAKYLKKKMRIMIGKMIKNFENKMEEMPESINKYLEELKNKETHRDKQHNY